MNPNTTDAMNRDEQIKNLTEGRDEHLIKWLSLEDWDKLPSERLMDDIAEAWDDCGGDMDALTRYTRYVRYLMGEDAVTVAEIRDDLIRDSELRREIVSYEFTEYEDGEGSFVEALEDRYDVFGQIIYDAMSEVRLNFRRSF